MENPHSHNIHKTPTIFTSTSNYVFLYFVQIYKILDDQKMNKWSQNTEHAWHTDHTQFQPPLNTKMTHPS